MAIDPCPVPPTPTVHGVVTFDPTVFKVAFPAFATVANGLLTADFTLATLFLRNTCGSIVCDAAAREVLLNLLVAHIAALLQGENGNPPSGFVGRVDKATEGSVSVSASYLSEMSLSEAYFSQTQYGAAFWMATAQYRSFQYVAPAPACFGPGFGPAGFWPGRY